MQKVFLDIGAHTGETITEVSKPCYGFDRVIAFEPSPRCFAALEALAVTDERIQICRFGLADGRQLLHLHGSGDDSATTLPVSHVGESPISVDTVLLDDATSWVQDNLNLTDLIVVKLNCEGGEVAILRSWIRSGVIANFYSVMITFDIRNFPSLCHQEVELRSQLRRLGYSNCCFADDVMLGPSHGERLAHWLGLFGLDQPPLPSVNAYREHYSDLLAHYASRRGSRQRLEHRLKRWLGYGSLPVPLKQVLRRLKLGLGLSTERV